MAGVVLGQWVTWREQVRPSIRPPRRHLALGAILRMLSGRRAFQGETSMDTLTAILKETRPIFQPSSVTFRPRWRVVELPGKSPAARFQSNRDLVLRSKDFPPMGPSAQPGPAGAPIVSAHRGLPRWSRMSPPRSLFQQCTCFAVPPSRGVDPFGHRHAADHRPDFALSPDGKWIVFSATVGGKTQLWLRAFDSATARPLLGTDDGMSPFWSPDSRAIGFFTLESLKRIDLSGGQPRTIVRSLGGLGGSWNRDGTIIFTQLGGLGAPVERVSENGGETAPVIRADPRQTALRFPQFLPDGRHFLYFALAGSEPGVYVGSLDGLAPKRLIEAGAPAVYAAGYLLVVNVQGTVFAKRFDPANLTLTGEQIQLATDVMTVTASETGLSRLPSRIAHWPQTARLV